MSDIEDKSSFSIGCVQTYRRYDTCKVKKRRYSWFVEKKQLIFHNNNNNSICSVGHV